MKKSVFKCICLWLLINNSIAAKQEKDVLSPIVKAGLQASIFNQAPAHLIFDNPKHAKIWLETMSNKLKKWISDDFLRERYLTLINYEANRAGLNPQLVLSIITVESKFNKYAISNAGARGLMQVMPFWTTYIGSKEHNLFDIKTNLRYGCTILSYYITKEQGNVRNALSRYNGSSRETWYPNLVLNAYHKYWQM